MHQDLSDRTLGFRRPAWQRVAMPACVVVSLTVAALIFTIWYDLYHLAVSAVPGHPLSVPVRFTAIVFGLAAAQVAIAGMIARRHVLDRRLEKEGEVEVTRVGLVVSVRPGHSQSILWEEVAELRVPWLTEATAHRALLLDIRGAGKRVRVPSFVEENQLLREIIIQRAGLTEKKQTFLGTRFMRPGREDG